MKDKRITTRGYDIAGAGNLRLLRVVLLWKLLRLDELGGKPRLTDMLGLTIRHHLGAYLAVITVKYEPQWLHVLRVIRHRRAVLIRRAGLIRDKLLGRL